MKEQKSSAIRACAVLVLFLTSLAVGFTAADSNGNAEAHGTATIAMVASVGGNISTLACYDPDPFVAHPSFPGKPNPWAPCRTTDDSPPDGATGAHGGMTAPTDIAGTGTVWLQNDYLPNSVRGGYLYAQDASTLCYSYPTNDSRYAGRRTKVWIYYYDTSSSSYQDVHEVYYGHISQNSGVLNVWKRWNNYWATSPMWPSYAVDYFLNNDWNGGMGVGSVETALGGSGCITGAHVHQETGSTHSEGWNTGLYSEGCWYTGAPPTGSCTTSGYQWITGKPVTGRFSDIQYVAIHVH